MDRALYEPERAAVDSSSNAAASDVVSRVFADDITRKRRWHGLVCCRTRKWRSGGTAWASLRNGPGDRSVFCFPAPAYEFCNQLGVVEDLPGLQFAPAGLCLRRLGYGHVQSPVY